MIAAARHHRGYGHLGQRPPRRPHTEAPRRGQPARVADLDVRCHALGHAHGARVGDRVQQSVRPARAGVFGRAGRAAPWWAGGAP